MERKTIIKLILAYVYQLKTYQEIQFDCSTNIEDKIDCKKKISKYLLFSCLYLKWTSLFANFNL